jgi:hypothetical protein
MSATLSHLRILKFTARGTNSLIGFADVQLASGMILHDVQIRVRAANVWAMPSSKAMLDRDNNTMRDDGNKVTWSNQISLVDKETRTLFSHAVIEAMRLAHPDVLADAS